MAKEATLRYLRVSPRKVRVLAGAIRGLPVGKALDYLHFSVRRPSKPLYKLLKSAIVNASREKGIDVDRLFIKELRVNGGPVMKRWLPRAKGSASPILKRTSHVHLVLGEKQ